MIGARGFGSSSIFLNNSDVRTAAVAPIGVSAFAGEGWLHELRVCACFCLLAIMVVHASGFVPLRGVVFAPGASQGHDTCYEGHAFHSFAVGSLSTLV
jgi:hypothetical protein